MGDIILRATPTPLWSLLYRIIVLYDNQKYHVYISIYIEWALLDQQFHLMCNCLPDDYQSTLVKLKKCLPKLSPEDCQQLGNMLSSSCEAQLVNEKIVTFLAVQLCYNSTGDAQESCDMDMVDSLNRSDKSGRYIVTNM